MQCTPGRNLSLKCSDRKGGGGGVSVEIRPAERNLVHRLPKFDFEYGHMLTQKSKVGSSRSLDLLLNLAEFIQVVTGLVGCGIDKQFQWL